MLIPFISCENNDNKKEATFLGGQIINPVSNFVIISDFNSKNDTIRLDDDGSFRFECESLETGLYTFRHGEIQFFYLEKGDSLLFRVNTVDFDESLAFSGKGAEKNNFLVSLFLKNESVAEKLPGYYKLSPAAYSAKIDSITNRRKNSLTELEESIPLSDDFIKIAQGTIDYNSYSQKERYLSKRLMEEEDNSSAKIPANFYDFRNKIAYSDSSLQNHYAYNRFLNRHFENLALSKINDEELEADFKQHKYKLLLIDSLVKTESLKNNLLRSNLRRYLIDTHDASRDTELLALFNKIDTNKRHQSEILKYAQKTSKLRKGEKVPEIILVTVTNETILLEDILKKKTVLFFWSKNSIRHYKEIHLRIAELKSKFPEYDYIGINTDNHFKKWQKTVLASGYSKTHEYQFENDKEAENELLINSVNKAIIIDNDSKIIDTYSNIFNQGFETKLLGYIN
ncbi:hypothetical protein ULMS_21210 [Patiriisocius marinistellae]|uniref:Thioredoxin domain-containing protein n=1 Tax=Patiriisocius marinistellae TaxID=2494560 RepID=A0A5J4FX45_9FLAO|nr:hypothetical protein ULMS_21210 [Patiriisocius marinistellae]